MGGGEEGSGEIQTCFRKGVGVPLSGLQLGFLRWVQPSGALQRGWSRRETAGWRGAAASRHMGPRPGGRVRPVGPGLVEGKRGPEAGVQCLPGLVVQLSGPAPLVAMSWEEVGNPYCPPAFPFLL